MGYTSVNDSAAFWGIGVAVSQRHSGVSGCRGTRVSLAQQHSMRCWGVSDSAAL